VWARLSCFSSRTAASITVAGLIAGGNTDQLRGDLVLARENALTGSLNFRRPSSHKAFYAGWPTQMSSITVAQQVFAD